MNIVKREDKKKPDKKLEKCLIVSDIISKMIFHEDERVIDLAREALMGKTIDQLKEYQ